MSSTSNPPARAATKEAFPSQDGPTRVSLASLASGATTLQSKHLFRGRIKTITPYVSNTKQCALVLESLQAEEEGTLHIVFNGTWSADLKEPFAQAKKLNSKVSLLGMDGVQKVRPGKDGKDRYRIEYSRGVEGFYENDEGEQVHFESKSKLYTNTKANSLATATSARTTPLQELFQASSASGSERQSGSQDASQENSTPDTASAGVKRPSAQEAKREKKRQKQKAEKREWGLEVKHSGEVIKYLSLKEAAQKIISDRAVAITKRSIIAIVMIAKPRGVLPTSKSKDWCSTSRLFDPSLPDGESVGINLFAINEAYMPDVQDGDVVIFDRINYDANASNFVGYKGFCFSVIRASSLAPSAAQPIPAKLPKIIQYGKQEWEYAKQLYAWWNEQDLPTVASGATEQPVPDAKAISAALRKKGGTTGRKQVELKDMEAGTFYDFIGEVQKIYPLRGGFEDENEVYLTDYTINTAVYDYTPEGDLEWKGAWGQRTLKCDLRGKLPKNLVPGSVLRIRNLLVKLDKRDLMEGTTWPDKDDRYGSPYTILRSDVTEMEAMKLRRTKYWRSQHDAINSGSADPTSTASQREEVKLLEPTTCTLHKPLGRMEDAIEGALGSPIRLRGRIVDLNPTDPLDWVRGSCPECKKRLVPGVITCLEHNKAEFTFNLGLYICEDFGDKQELDENTPGIKVSVSGAAASAFLGLEPTSGMRQEGTEQGILRKRLEPILGRILSSKKRNPDNDLAIEDVGAPFEFGVIKIKEKKPGGEPTFAFVGTKIS